MCESGSNWKDKYRDAQAPPWMYTHSSPATFAGGSTRPSRFGWYNPCAAVQNLPVHVRVHA